MRDDRVNNTEKSRLRPYGVRVRRSGGGDSQKAATEYFLLYLLTYAHDIQSLHCSRGCALVGVVVTKGALSQT